MSGSRAHLQRALLDAAAILSSAANIARRAAAVAVDVRDASPAAAAASPESPTAWSTGGAATMGSSKSENRASAAAVATAAMRDTPLLYNRGDSAPFSAPLWPSHALAAARAGVGMTAASCTVAAASSSKLVREQEPSRDAVPQGAAIIGDMQQQGQLSHEACEVIPLAQEAVKDTTATADSRALRDDAPLEESFSRSTEDSAAISDSTFSKTDSTTPQLDRYPSHAKTGVEAESPEEYDATKENLAVPLRSAKVPSSRIARLLHYGSLGAGLAWGAAGSYVRGGSAQGDDKQFMSDDNVRRLVDKLSTMRGAALKLGQFMSIQDSNLLPEQIEQVMLRVQNSAHYMPQWQMEKVMRQDLGTDWRSSFESFSDVPFASASIGQVHAAILSASHPSPLAGKKVAVKVQFPGVRESIGSDLSNLRWLVTASALLPRGLFLDNTIRVMRRELDDECNYEREREMCKRFGEILNREESGFAVPRVVDDLCSSRVLTCEMMFGRPLTQAGRYSQEKRDRIARAILDLSLRELFTFRLMQTDPNWTNFLYNERTDKIELIDFGATREYSKAFMDDWLCMLQAAISGDREVCVTWSEKVGYLTGDESDTMRAAHVDSMIALGEPFRSDAPDPYPFEGQTITSRVRAQVPLMLRERLTPPPEPTYSLNRKLSGAFLLCARLRANVSCHGLFEQITRGYKLGDGLSATSYNVSPVQSRRPQARGVHTVHSPQREAQQPKRRRPGLVNLADRWPRHVVSAVERNVQEGSDRSDGTFVSIASEPAATSMSSTPPDPQATGTDKASQANLRTEPVGGQNVRPSDAAESPTTAREDSTEPSSNVASKPVQVRGISVPKKPTPPGPEDCCMSGCARCVYDLYAEDLQDYQQDLTSARSRLMSLSPPIPMEQWDESLLGPKPLAATAHAAGPGQDGSQPRTAEERAQSEVDAVIGQLDPSMRAFLQLERSLKKKGKHPTSTSNKE